MSRSARCAALQASVVLLTVVVTGWCLPARATFVVSGDGTPAFSLTDDAPDNQNAGNRRFFSNLLGPGSSVLIADTSLTVATFRFQVFYRGLPGVGADILSSDITPAALVGVDLLVLPFPDAAFTPEEVTAIAGFHRAGGTVFVNGESPGITAAVASNQAINDLLAGAGSSLRIGTSGRTFDIGNQVATGSQIESHPLTTGVSAFNYGSTAEVIGGVPLFWTADGTPFVAVEVPEPAAWMTLTLLGGLAGGRRRSLRR